MANSGYVRYSRQYVHKRCKKLVDHGRLKHLVVAKFSGIGVSRYFEPFPS